MPKKAKVVMVERFDFGTLPVSVRQALEQFVWHGESAAHNNKRTAVEILSITVTYRVKSAETKPQKYYSGPIGY